MQTAAIATGIRLVILKATAPSEIEARLSSIPPSHVDALYVATDPFFLTRADQLVALTARYRTPTLFFRREFVAKGGLMSYGSTSFESYRMVGLYAGRILRGAKPSELPVQQPTKFEFVINLMTAKTLGVRISDNLLAIADEVIE